MSDSAGKFETQHQRWLKYVANVGLTIVVAAAVVVLLIYLAQHKDHRFDTTAEGSYSLKPQTRQIIENLKTPITLVSLYSHQSNRENSASYAQAVEDLLNEYKADGQKINVEFIDPLSQPSKEDALINEVTAKYGGEVKAYKQFLDDYAKQYQQIKDATAAESKGVADLPFDKVQNQDLARALLLIIDTVEAFPQFLENKQNSIDRLLKQKPPDYKGAVDSVQSSMEELSQRLGAIDDEIDKDKSNPATPDAVKKYLSDGLPRFAAIKKQADDIDDKAKKLGDLKLDTLRTSLKERDSILVMGENDLRVLSFGQVWKAEDMLRQYAKGGKVKPSFAGEQLITTAIYGLTQSKRQKVVFVRPGGSPLCEPGIPGFQQGGPLSEAAERLREYNFEVQEKDLSGQYAMQAQMQGQPAPPEPTDAEMKEAIWVVIAAPFNSQSPMGPAPSKVGPMLEEHLKNGGSAFVLPFPHDDDVTPALAAWGIDLRTDAICVHDTPPPDANASTNNPVEDFQRYPQVFDIRHYGDSPITNPLHS
ncbi:MAG: Gldg family protein, partial [Phycisphaerae bacterium]|nr:Gldg family protein [Phycisphaerae bacterium]